jgi:hypothetical protein
MQKEKWMAVNTARVEGRRKVAYASYEELLADANRVATGPVQTLGNWSPGQIFRHLAIVYNGAIDGLKTRAPWYLRVPARLFRRWVINRPIPAGFKLPGTAAEELVPPPTSTEAGLAELEAAVARLEREPHRAAHPIFGIMTPEEWRKLNLNHASMHMSFLVPQ